VKAECPVQIWKFKNPLLSLLPFVRNEEVLQKEAKAAKGIFFKGGYAVCEG
jgi:hypothetical protein